MIPFVDLKPQHKQIKEKLLKAWEEIIDCTGFVGGPWVNGFETQFASMLGADHCVSVSSGTDALEVALRALNVKSGDEVILPANTFVATAEAVMLVGATPVLVDCTYGTWNIDASLIEEKISNKTVGIIGVHLYGQPCDMDRLKEISSRHDLWLLEDSAQSHFAMYKEKMCGSLGTAAAFSFYPGKNLGATGEGGAVTTSDESLANRIHQIKNHGSSDKYVHEILGNNSRMSSMIAAALSIKLEYILEWTEDRRNNAKTYIKLLSNIEGIELPVVEEWANPVWHLFVIHTKRRDELHSFLKKNGVSTGFHYPVPLHMQKVFEHSGYVEGQFPNAEYNANYCLSLPMYAELSCDDIKHVCALIKEFVNNDKK